MNKAILMSIQPKWVAKILNGEKTIEVRKKFPKDYVGWVYIYCTKDNKEGLHIVKDKWVCIKHNKVLKECCYNGTVVARFWCDKVEEITPQLWTPTKEQEILKSACLTENDLFNYIGDNSKKPFYAIHISKLEVFDKSKEIGELKSKHYPQFANMEKNAIHYELVSIKNAPQNFCYVEDTL